MQLHWFALLPTIVMLKNRRIGLILIKFLIIISICYVSMQIYLHDLPPGYVPTTEK